MNNICIKTKIIYGENALDSLNQYKGKNIWIVCDKFLVESKNIDQLTNKIEKNKITIFSDVVPDPPLPVVIQGIKIMEKVNPDIVIAYGGGSAIDTAKGIMYFAKKTEKINPSKKIKFIAIPTTSGTGSEVTSFTIISDPEEKIKHTIVDDSLLPDEAILEPQLTLTVPPEITANTGMDVLTHALEAYVSTKANPYTDAMAEKSIELVVNSLIKCYKQGRDQKARSDMQQASNLAGMAFNTAGLGINHSIAHQLGGMFHIPHGMANAILLEKVISFNANDHLTKSKYANLTYKLGLVDKKEKEDFAIAVLCQMIVSMKKIMGMPLSIKQYGIDEVSINTHKEKMAYNALNDLCTTTNPRTVNEIDIIQLINQI